MENSPKQAAHDQESPSLHDDRGAHEINAELAADVDEEILRRLDEAAQYPAKLLLEETAKRLSGDSEDNPTLNEVLERTKGLPLPERVAALQDAIGERLSEAAKQPLFSSGEKDETRFSASRNGAGETKGQDAAKPGSDRTGYGVWGVTVEGDLYLAQDLGSKLGRSIYGIQSKLGTDVVAYDDKGQINYVDTLIKVADKLVGPQW